jgi:hypothetical protein
MTPTRYIELFTTGDEMLDLPVTIERDPHAGVEPYVGPVRRVELPAECVEEQLREWSDAQTWTPAEWREHALELAVRRGTGPRMN